MVGGLLLAALFMTLGVAVFAGALALLLGALPAVDPKAVDALFIMIGKSLIALGVLALVGGHLCLDDTCTSNDDSRNVGRSRLFNNWCHCIRWSVISCLKSSW